MTAFKTIYLFSLWMIAGIFMSLAPSCESLDGDTPTPFPDFSGCNCTLVYEPVCDRKGRNFLNECFASCVETKIVSNGLCAADLYQARDTLTWPIEQVCIPVAGIPREVRNLGDGTVLYQRADSSYFRGTVNRCRCLPGESLIATPTGKVPISQLAKGDTVWTLSEEGKVLKRPIAQIHRVPIATDFLMIKLRLADGRGLKVSPLHPDLYGLPLANLQLGDTLDGAKIVSRYWEMYTGAATWDILPEGPTGAYLVQGIWIGSTLAPTKSSVGITTERTDNSFGKKSFFQISHMN